MGVTPGAGGGPAGIEDSGHGGDGIRASVWFPLVLFGALALAVSPLYTQPAPGTADLLHLPLYFLGTLDPTAADAKAILIFWLVAAPLGYLATFVFYRTWARRHGVEFPARSYLLTGLALLMLLAEILLAQRALLGNLADLYSRGLTPLLAVAAGLLVLAHWQRNGAVGIFAVLFLGLAVLVNLYDLANLTGRIGISTGNRTNIVVVGATLVLAGAAFGLTDLAARRRTP